VYGLPHHAPRRPLPRVEADVELHLKRAQRAREFVIAGRHAAAERLLRDVAAALMRRGRSTHAARLLLDLGRIRLERARPVHAEEVFDEAAALAAAGDEGLVIDARLWQVAARSDAGRLVEAESVCRAVIVANAIDAGQRAWGHALLARLLLWQGRLREALDLDLNALPEHRLDDETTSTVAAMRVRLLVAADRLFEAGICAGALRRAAATASPLARAIAQSAQLRVSLAAGDVDAGQAHLHEVIRLSRESRAPLRAARARLQWAAALARAGRTADALRELHRLERMGAAGPSRLSRAVAQQLREVRGKEGQATRAAGGPVPPLRTVGSPIAALVAAAHEEEDDADAVRRMLDVVSTSMDCSRIDLWSADAGPSTAIVSVGSGLATMLGGRVLESGLALGPEAHDGGPEVGVPVRRARRLIAAIVGRWPADRTPPSGAREVFELAALISGPRVDAMLSIARESSRSATAIPELIGASAAADEVRSVIARAAAAPFSVLIEGESGVGKELVARAVHQLSPRRERRFCDLNCAALPDDLLESELFGHARGAFTGAVHERAGLFEDADGGTLFLDELADLSPRAQAKLLRVVQQQEVRRVGETFSRKIDVRLVTAANRDMNLEAQSGRFRQDLLYRLNVIRIRIPPLRERPDDISLLAQHFWQAAAGRVGTDALLTHGVLAALTRYHWPGNVRELQNVMAALAVAAPSRGHVRPNLLPAAISGATGITCARLSDARAQFERRAIESALARAGGSRTRAARELGLSRQGLLKMMARLDIK
jgi:transcriptional regulator with AAA-type ATPase domain